MEMKGFQPDLRALPADIPVPHVESSLAFGFDVNGRFSRSFLRGQARFDDSVFLGAEVGAGTVGAIDTSVTPFHYAGEGDISGIDLPRFGTDLAITWPLAGEPVLSAKDLRGTPFREAEYFG